ncbi:hypothetical protein AA15669_0568 [Saccharibacter floricola DSM 15669]|uniref:Uncharacterized protein n=1 Tax=Saccharibacter floricola DSM 15669 TaxID=1123227 RepID=A0ABQ0NXQ0_9PROT|nr:hypothetical protein AA15669_0568 [Saccharibacter floricola DSM 15669]
MCVEKTQPNKEKEYTSYNHPDNTIARAGWRIGAHGRLSLPRKTGIFLYSVEFRNNSIGGEVTCF